MKGEWTTGTGTKRGEMEQLTHFSCCAANKNPPDIVVCIGKKAPIGTISSFPPNANSNCGAVFVGTPFLVVLMLHNLLLVPERGMHRELRAVWEQQANQYDAPAIIPTRPHWALCASPFSFSGTSSATQHWGGRWATPPCLRHFANHYWQNLKWCI